MRYGDCPLCAFPHDPAARCSPGRKLRYEIPFPAWVKVTQCEHVSHSRTFATAHGYVRFVTHEPTPHGRAMDLWRARKAEAAEQTVVGEPSLPLVVGREAYCFCSALLVGHEYDPQYCKGVRPGRRVPANVTPGRYAT